MTIVIEKPVMIHMQKASLNSKKSKISIKIKFQNIVSLPKLKSS